MQTPTTRLVRYGGAMSLDGYIAGPNGEYDCIVIDPEIDFAGMSALQPELRYLSARRVRCCQRGDSNRADVVCRIRLGHLQ